jgi:3-hydroxymyristoyl/3-hydroxydecanoyl-(acyl carrier protein) dehydratase
VPLCADFFADHFPRRPVYPATLLLDAMMRQASALAQDVMTQAVQVVRITHVKVRSFTEPGTDLILFAEAPQRLDDEPDVVMLKVGARNDGRTIAGARIFFSSNRGS